MEPGSARRLAVHHPWQWTEQESGATPQAGRHLRGANGRVYRGAVRAYPFASVGLTGTRPLVFGHGGVTLRLDSFRWLSPLLPYGAHLERRRGSFGPWCNEGGLDQRHQFGSHIVDISFARAAARY